MTKVSADHKVISAELQICRKIRRQFARRAINDLVIIRATVANEGDSGELVNHFRRVGRAGIAIRIHQRNMVVLEADGFSGLFMIQRGKKIVPWNSLSPGLTIRLTSVPVGSVQRFCRYFPPPAQCTLPDLSPSDCRRCRCEYGSRGCGHFDVNLVVPAVVVGIDQMFTDKAAEVMFVESAHHLFSSVLLRTAYVFKNE